MNENPMISSQLDSNERKKILELKALTSKRYIAACAKVKEFIHKDAKGFGYTYCTLPSLLEATNKIMPKHDFGIFQTPDFRRIVTKVIDLKTGGTFLESSLELPNNELIHKNITELMSAVFTMPKGTINPTFLKYLESEVKGYSVNQEIGASITYWRRYILFTILNLQPEDDYDGMTKKRFDFLKKSKLEFSGSPKAKPKEVDDNRPPIIEEVQEAPIEEAPSIDQEIQELYSQLPKIIKNPPALESFTNKYKDKKELRDKLKEFISGV